MNVIMNMIMNMESWRNTVAGEDDWVVDKVGIEEEAEIFDFIKENGYNTPEIRHAVVRSLQHRACYIVAADKLLGVLCLEITGELAVNVIIVTPHERRKNIASDMLKAVARDTANNAYKYLILKDIPEDTAFIFKKAVGAKKIPV